MPCRLRSVPGSACYCFPRLENLPSSGRVGLVRAAARFARSPAAWNNRQRRLAADTRSRAGDPALAQQTSYLRKHLPSIAILLLLVERKLAMHTKAVRT